MIISIASSASSISGQFIHPFPAGLSNAFDTYKQNDMQANRHDAPSPSSYYNPEAPLKNLLQAHPAGRMMMRYIGDNDVICEVRITKEVFAEEGYEFFPSEYINKTCISSSTDPHIPETNGIKKPEVCLHNDNEFGCQTLYEDLNVLKKSIRGRRECWEHTTQLVAVGCKCNIRFKY